MIKMNRNKEYRLKRKSQRKDYIIQDKNLTIKTLYYRNETKRNKIEQLEQKNEQLQNNWHELKKWLEEIIEDIDKIEYPDSYDKGEKATLKSILRHMQELEQGKDENN